MEGAFFNSGQSCCAVEVNCPTTLLFFEREYNHLPQRIYVHESIYDSFVERFVAITKVCYVSPLYFRGDKLNNI